MQQVLSVMYLSFKAILFTAYTQSSSWFRARNTTPKPPRPRHASWWKSVRYLDSTEQMTAANIASIRLVQQYKTKKEHLNTGTCSAIQAPVVAVWPSGNCFGHTNTVTLRWARLALTIYKYTILVCNQSLKPTQPPTMALAMHHRLSGPKWPQKGRIRTPPMLSQKYGTLVYITQLW